MLAGCIHLLRGTPYIYQGEELGIPNAGARDIGQYRDVETLNYHKILQEFVVYCNFRSHSVHTAKELRQYPATGWRLLLSNYAEGNSLAELRPYELMVLLKD